MQRFVRLVVLAASTGMLAGCDRSAAPEEADIVVAPLALVQSLAEDREAALATYGGKVLELSGTVAEKIQPGGLNPTMGLVFAGIDEQLAFDANLSFVAFDSEDEAAAEEFESLVPGDTVTLHCLFDILNESASLFLVKGCRLVR